MQVLLLGLSKPTDQKPPERFFLATSKIATVFNIREYIGCMPSPGIIISNVACSNFHKDVELDLMDETSYK